MPDKQRLQLDLVALVLLAMVVFMAVALFTHDPFDPPSAAQYPPKLEVANACGRLGAWLAYGLTSAFGLGAYYVLLSVIVLDSWLFSHKPITEPWPRFSGWVLSLVSLCTFMAMLVPGWSPGPVIGSGGHLGAVGRALLEMHVAAAGAYILTISLLLAGWLLCTDYVLVTLSAWAIRTPARQVGRGLALAGKSISERRDKQASGGRKLRLAPRREELLDELPDAASPPIGRADVLPGQIDLDESESDEEPLDDGEVAATPSAARSGTAAAQDPAPDRELRVKPRGKQAERALVIDELEAGSRSADAADYELPSVELLLAGEPVAFDAQEKEVRRKAKILERTFQDFGFNVKVVEIETGPVIAQFEVELEAGLRLAKITSLADDLAIALRVPSVRIVAPIPGKNTVGIEVPNTDRQLVRLREVIEESEGKAQKMKIPIFLGKDVAGGSLVVDLATLPHLLIAGRTGTGKSVCLNSIIVSLLMTRRPDEVRMLLVDPKMVELSAYKSLPHLMHPVVTDMRKAEAILAWAVDKMEERYALLARAGVRHISGYNQLGEEELLDRLQPESDDERSQIPTHLPYIVMVADEMADLMMTSAKEVETHIIRLAQKSRAVGIHLVLATQKPTVDVITGLIKSNLPARIAFQVASRTDSRVVLDEMGADKLLGNGDMLFLWPGTSVLLRGQGTYVSDDEINRVVECVSTTEPEFVKELVQLKSAAAGNADADRFKNRDELYEAAIDIVVREGRGSVSLLQRALGIGYGRGARLIDFMAEDGIVGAYNGSQAREVLVTLEQWEAMSGQRVTEPEPTAKPPRKIVTAERTNRPLPDEDDAPFGVATPRYTYHDDETVDSFDDDEQGAQDEDLDDGSDDVEDDTADDEYGDDLADGEYRGKRA